MDSGKRSFLKNMVGFSMTTWISFAVSLISSPIATRIFAPEEMGRINMFNTYASLFSALCYLGLDQAYVRFFREPPGRVGKRGMLAFCLVTSLAFSLVSSLLLSLGWRGITESATGAQDFGVFLCLCVFSFSLVMFRYLSLIYRMEQNALMYTVQGVIFVLVTKIAYLSAGFAVPLARPAIITLTLLTGLVTLAFLIVQRRDISLKELKAADGPFFKEMAVYAAPLIPITVISWLNSSVSQLSLNMMSGFADVGIYTSAVTLASSVNVIQSGFSTYWAPYVFENYKSDNRHRFFTVHRVMACALTMFGLLLTLLQAPVFLLLGRDYRGAVTFFPFLFLAPICYCLSETTGMGIGIAKKTYWNTIIFGASVLCNFLLCLALIPAFGMTGAALASAAAAILSLTLRTVIGERYYKAIYDYRCIFITIGFMLASAFGNLLLGGYPLVKYALLTALPAVAALLFRKEIQKLTELAGQITGEILSKVRRRGGRE